MRQEIKMSSEKRVKKRVKRPKPMSSQSKTLITILSFVSIFIVAWGSYFIQTRFIQKQPKSKYFDFNKNFIPLMVDEYTVKVDEILYSKEDMSLYSGVVYGGKRGEECYQLNYLNGKLNGKVYFWKDRCCYLKVTSYKDGKLDGPLEVFYETGQLESKRFYKNGELDGPLETYYDNGQLKSKGNYQEGKKVGTSERYHSNGQLKTKNNYKGGKLDGVHEIYHENDLEKMFLKFII